MAVQETSSEMGWPAHYIMNVTQELCSVVEDWILSVQCAVTCSLFFHHSVALLLENETEIVTHTSSCHRPSKRENLVFVSLFLREWND